ncbi:MAG: oxygen-independent coproporphyrinogen III oxidase [Rhizomicrobium sp.]
MRKPEDIFAARVPRYTSYPTAPHFHAGIGADVYRTWLGECDPGLPLSLYVHIPFCDTLCWFCGCHTRVVNAYGPVAAYLDLLYREMELVTEALGARRRVSHIHWGGGSPTLLQPADIRRLSAVLHDFFAVEDGAEFAIEIDPRGFTAATAEALAEAGLTRASIGVQDYAPQVQRAINRLQDAATTAHCVRLLRANGIDRLNIDLIYGLPHQTTEGLIRTIDAVLELAPDRLAVFGYAHVPAFKKHMALIPEAALPGIAERYRQSETARARLLAAGYVAIGLDHFARPSDPMARALAAGKLSRNFQGYTTDDAQVLLGFGASAIGSLPQGYVQNLSDVPAWRAAIRGGALPIARGVALSADDRLRRDIIGALMCNLSVDLAAVSAAHHLAPPARPPALDTLAAEGAVTIDGSTIKVTERSAVRLACAAFDAYLGGAGGHSSAI